MTLAIEALAERLEGVVGAARVPEDALLEAGALPATVAQDTAFLLAELAAIARWARARFPAHPRDLAGQRVALRLARSVSIAPARALLLPLLRGASRVLVAAPETQRPLLEWLRASLGVGSVVERSAARSRSEFTAEVRSWGARTLHAYGSGETLATLRDDLPEGVEFEGRGHGFGVLIVGHEALAHTDALARAALEFDGQGCLSPQTLFAPRELAPRLAETLLEALALELRTRGPREAASVVALRGWRAQQAARGTQLLRTEHACVALLERTEPTSSPGGGHLALAPYDNLLALRAALAPHARWLTAVGATLGPESLSGWVGEGRVTAPEQMQRAPLDASEPDATRAGYADPRSPTRR